MNGFEKFLAGKKAKSAKAWSRIEEKYRGQAIGILLADYREKAGLSLSELSRRIKMQKSAISRLENHGEDVRLSTMTRYVEATGHTLFLKISVPNPARSGKQRSGAKVELKGA